MNPFAKYLGIPVTVQLKETFVMVGVSGKKSAPHFPAREPVYTPQAVMQPEGPATTHLIDFAILSEIEGSSDMLEMMMLAPGPIEKSTAVTSTLLPVSLIAFVTRIGQEPKEPSMILAP